MRRSALFIAAASWALLPVAAFADPVNDAVYATAKAAAQKNQIPWEACVAANGSAGCVVAQAFKGAIDTFRSCGGGSASASWMAVIRCVVTPGAKVGDGLCTGLYCGGGFDGGGASGSWEPACNWGWNLDSDGNLIVPSVKLYPGGVLPKASTMAESSSKYFSTTAWTLVGGRSVADKPDAAMLRRVHRYNLTLGSTPSYWYGVYKLSGGTYYFSRVVSYDNNGNKIAFTAQSYNTPASWAYHTGQVDPGAKVDCPSQTSGGGTFDFYVEMTSTATNAQETCVMYANEVNSTSSGYAYPDQAIWPKASVLDFPNGRDDLADCRVAPALIKKIVEEAFKSAGYAVTNADPVNGPTEPKVSDLGQPSNAGPTDPQTTTNPSPTPSPSPSPSSSSTTSVNLDLGPAGPDTLKSDSNFTPPDWSWWPSMPSISIGTSAECPTYQFTAFDMQFTLDAHCTFIEQYRSLIAALMVIVFTIAAARVVLEA